jgi:hypothetical protein
MEVTEHKGVAGGWGIACSYDNQCKRQSATKNTHASPPTADYDEDTTVLGTYCDEIITEMVRFVVDWAKHGGAE